MWPPKVTVRSPFLILCYIGGLALTQVCITLPKDFQKFFSTDALLLLLMRCCHFKILTFLCDLRKRSWVCINVWVTFFEEEVELLEGERLHLHPPSFPSPNLPVRQKKRRPHHGKGSLKSLGLQTLFCAHCSNLYVWAIISLHFTLCCQESYGFYTMRIMIRYA